MRNILSPAFRPRSSQGRGAFSLLEVAIALVIFVIGAIALLRIFPSGLNVLENSANRRVAAQMSQNLLTSYNSGDLAQTTPDAIYDADASGIWNDYPLSALGLKRQVGTVPIGPDDFSSAKDGLKYINGERQGVFAGAAYPSNVADGRVTFFREGVVTGATINQALGQLDFRNARYLRANRADVDAAVSKVPFRQAFLDEAEGVPVNNGLITLTRSTTGSTSYTITWPFRRRYAMDDVSGITLSAMASGTDCTVTPSGSPSMATTDTMSVTVNVPVATNQQNQYFQVDFVETGAVGVVRRTYVCKIVGPQGEPTTAAPVPSRVLPIRAPNEFRANCVYYVSSSKNNGAIGIYEQPITLPPNYPQDVVGSAATIPSTNSALRFDSNLLIPLRFKQRLGTVGTTRDGAPVVVPTGAADVDGLSSTNLITQVALEYSVRDWEYISEDVSQFGQPFTASNAQVDPNTPEGLVQYGFTQAGNYPMNRIPLSEVREIRTRVGNLRGAVFIKGLYSNPSAQPDAQAIAVSFDVNGTVLPTASSVQVKDFVRRVKSFGKEGRLYLPATFTTSTASYSLSRARVYYRSKDAWVQQVGAAASHYLPFQIGAISTTREEWREYFLAADNYIYFHAADAGKTVEVLQGTSLSDSSAKTIEIREDILFVDAMPSNVPPAFAQQRFNKPGDPRHNKFYLARSRDRIGANIFDVRRPTGTSGISVRTMWLDGTRYAQEIAQ